MTASRSFIVIGLLLLGWNLMGVAAFITQYTADLKALGESDPYTARLFATMPVWAWIVYATAVAAGTLGAALLLLRSAAAVPSFLISTVAVMVQFSYSFFGTDLLATKGATAAIFPVVILAVAAGQFLYARSLKTKRLLR